MLKKICIILIGLLVVGACVLSFIQIPAPTKEVVKKIPEGQFPS